MNTYIMYWRLFIQFLKRDYYIRRKKFWDNFLNFSLIYPIVFGLGTAYFQANSYFGNADITKNTMLFAGNIILIMMLFTYKQNIELLFDLESKRYIDYQLTLCNPWVILSERILFTALYTFIILVPFYPVASLLLHSYLDMSNVSWIKIIILLFFGSFCLSAYHLFAACILESSMSISTLWNRANNILISFGGFWIPWFIIATYSPLLGFLIFANPCIYITDGLKGALSQSELFLSFDKCILMLCFFTIVFTCTCFWAFKRKTDCVY